MLVDTAFVPTLPLAERMAPGTQSAPEPTTPRREPSYYDVPLLTPVPWKWEIASYFYLGGLSAGAYLLARLAERFGGADPSFRKVTQTGTTVAALTLAPCPLLLVKDLGDPSRFHHMLRVFKPTSPMNLGAWTLTGYSGATALSLLHEWGLVNGVVLVASDAAGLPLAILLAGYTGVLLSGTSTPLWSGSNWLGPLFSASAIATGAAAISLAVSLQDSRFHESPAGRALESVKVVAHAAEAVALQGYLTEMGDLAAPLKRQQALPFWGSAAASAGAGLLSLLPLPGVAGRVARTLSTILGLAGGYALRWSMVHAGHPSALEPEYARRASRPPRGGERTIPEGQ